MLWAFQNCYSPLPCQRHAGISLDLHPRNLVGLLEANPQRGAKDGHLGPPCRDLTAQWLCLSGLPASPEPEGQQSILWPCSSEGSTESHLFSAGLDHLFCEAEVTTSSRVTCRTRNRSPLHLSHLHFLSRKVSVKIQAVCSLKCVQTAQIWIAFAEAQFQAEMQVLKSREWGSGGRWPRLPETLAAPTAVGRQEHPPG